MANASLVTESRYSMQLNNLSKEQVLALKGLMQNPFWNPEQPELEPKVIKELRKVIWDACKEVYP